MRLWRFCSHNRVLSAMAIALVLFCLVHWLRPKKPLWIKSPMPPQASELWYLREQVSADTGTQGCTIVVPESQCLVTVMAKDKTGFEVLTIRRYHKRPYCQAEDFSKPLPKLGPIMRRQCLTLKGLLGENANIEGILLLLFKRVRADGL